MRRAALNTLWMCVALAAAILAAFFVVVLGTPTKPAEAAFPGRNGKIVFESRGHFSAGPGIFTVKANGDDLTLLTRNGLDPAFSPNGQKIAFAGGSGIVIMSANGTDKRRVTTSEVGVLDPAWSPDGTKIAFQGFRNGEEDIYVINKDGTGLTRITTSEQIDDDPAWSPDGTRIAFVRGTYGGEKIYLMKAARESATNIPKRLTTAQGSGPAWSPDGTRIVYAGSPEHADVQLYAIRPNGSDLSQLTNSPTNNFDPAWSPDGTKIAFERIGGAECSCGRIYVMNAAKESATNRPKRLTGSGFLGDPDWQPLPAGSGGY